MRRTKRTTRARTPTLQPSLLPALNPSHPDPPFTLLTLAWLPMHVPTQIATLGPLCQLENAYEGTINYKKIKKIVLILRKNQNKNVKK